VDFRIGDGLKPRFKATLPPANRRPVPDDTCLTDVGGEDGSAESDALTPRVLVQRHLDPLCGRNLGLGIFDRRFGQLGGPISGCDCV
jgi:hypothetical protein